MNDKSDTFREINISPKLDQPLAKDSRHPRLPKSTEDHPTLGEFCTKMLAEVREQLGLSIVDMLIANLQTKSFAMNFDQDLCDIEIDIVNKNSSAFVFVYGEYCSFCLHFHGKDKQSVQVRSIEFYISDRETDNNFHIEISWPGRTNHLLEYSQTEPSIYVYLEESENGLEESPYNRNNDIMFLERSLKNCPKAQELLKMMSITDKDGNHVNVEDFVINSESDVTQSSINISKTA